MSRSLSFRQLFKEALPVNSVVQIKHEEGIVWVSVFVIFLGFLTALHNHRLDHIFRTLWTMGLLTGLMLVQRTFKPPRGVIGAILRPFFNVRTVMILAIFLAVHVSLVNVPFTHYDLFHKDWRNADMISHFLGGLTLWLMIAEVLVGLSEEGLAMSRREAVLYSFLIFYGLALGWEVAEKLSEGSISFIQESTLNKVRDVIMDTLGALLGLWLVTRKGYPFELAG